MATYTFALVFFIIFGLIGLGFFAFWIWAISDCATNNYLRGNDKIVWILVVIFAGLIGAIIYYFVARKSIAYRQTRDDYY